MTASEVTARLLAARVHLKQAHEELDAAVRALPHLGAYPQADDIMATPMVVALLLRVRTAKECLRLLEVIDATQTKAPTAIGSFVRHAVPV